MKSKNSKTGIEIMVGLDDNKIPEIIEWRTTGEKETPDFQEAKAFLLSFFDKKSKDTLKIDLWTSEMQVIEMDRFMFQTLRALGDTYFKSTGNNELASDFQKFVSYFGQKTGTIPSDDEWK